MRFNEKFARDFAKYFITTAVDEIVRRVVKSSGDAGPLQHKLKTDEAEVEVRVHLATDEDEEETE